MWKNFIKIAKKKKKISAINSCEQNHLDSLHKSNTNTATIIHHRIILYRVYFLLAYPTSCGFLSLQVTVLVFSLLAEKETRFYTIKLHKNSVIICESLLEYSVTQRYYRNQQKCTVDMFHFMFADVCFLLFFQNALQFLYTKNRMLKRGIKQNSLSFVLSE